MISDSSLDALKAAIDIVDVVGNYIELKKSGANYKAPCPFHDEKSASFVVSPQKQIYHCFGCGAGGDAIGFVREYRHLEFAEAVEEIAADMNFTLQYTKGSEDRKDYAKLMEHVNDRYRSGLGPQQRDYLEGRGVTPESIEAFEIGYAGTSRDQLDDLRARLFSLTDAEEVGVIARDGDRLYARQTDRITFPIRNHAGKLVGFGGRILSGDRAKYLNSPQTPLFDKSRQLYGYHIARPHIHRKGTITVTEGYLDVVMLHQAGIRTAVATMGTALTEQHCHTIKKAGARALLCYDGDRAGRAAALKAARLLSAHEIYGGVVLFPDGKDPADMVRDGRTADLIALLKHPVELIPFVISETAAAHDLERPDAKQQALREITAFLDTLPPLIRDEYRPLVASTLRIDPRHVATRRDDAPVQYPPVMRGEIINIAEMSVIKSAAEDPALFDILLDFTDGDIFRYHRDAYDLLAAGDPALQGRLISPELRVYTAEELAQQLNIMKIAALRLEFDAVVADTTIAYDRKAFELKRLKGAMMRMRKELTRKEIAQ